MRSPRFFSLVWLQFPASRFQRFFSLVWLQFPALRFPRLSPLIWLLLPTVLLLTSCQTTYVSNPANIPLLSQDGEFQGGLGVGPNGFNLQTVWAPVEHLALMGNASTYTISDSILEPDFRRTYGEIGAGYWTRLNKYLRFETFAGTGWGITGEFPQRDLYRRYFFQPNIGASTRYYDLGFSPRLSIVRFVEQRGVATPIETDRSGVFLEPIIQGRVGYEEFKFQLQIGPTLSLDDAQFDFRRWNVSIGVSLTLGKDFERYLLTPQ